MVLDLNEIGMKEKPKKNPWKVITITLLLVIFIGGMVYGFYYFTNNSYEIGLQDGSRIIFAQLVNEISTSGSIPIAMNATNIQWIPLEQICGGVGE